RLVPALQGAAELPRGHRQMGECRLPRVDAAPRHRDLAADCADRAGVLTNRLRREMLMLRLVRSAVIATLLIAAFAQPAPAQSYPTQNITVTVAFAAGGIADVIARLVGHKLSERLKHTVVVENRGGAGGNLAAKAVSGAAADGYTLLATTTALAVSEI